MSPEAKAIQTRHRAGASLAATHYEDPALYSAAKRLHGKWTTD